MWRNGCSRPLLESMAELKSSDVLNRVVARVYRSLLQYAVDCWPWTTSADTVAAESAEQKAIEPMTARQQVFVARLVEQITQRGDVVDFGSFRDNSELHYVSLAYLLGKLIADEKDLVVLLQAALSALGHDAEAAPDDDGVRASVVDRRRRLPVGIVFHVARSDAWRKHRVASVTPGTRDVTGQHRARPESRREARSCFACSLSRR